MASLAYRALDAHVIAGRGDDPVLMDDRGTLTYADLLGESAAIAGALRHLGVSAVTFGALSERIQLTALLACARIHAEVTEDADHLLEGDPPVLHTPGDEVGWDMLRRAGQSDPHEAPAEDPDGYAERLAERFSEQISGLLSGRSPS